MNCFRAYEHNLLLNYTEKIWGLSAPKPGNRFDMSIRIAAYPGRSYVAAIALTCRPGIPIDSRNIPLNPDNLFAASFTVPQVFVNFSGILNASGAGVASEPNGAAAIVLDAAAPSGVGAISRQYGVTIQ